MILKFGKYQGQDTADVPISYIKWLEEQDWVKGPLREECEHLIQKHDDDRPGLGKEIHQPNTTLSVSVFKNGVLKKYTLTGEIDAVNHVRERLNKLAKLELE